MPAMREATAGPLVWCWHATRLGRLYFAAAPAGLAYVGLPAEAAALPDWARPGGPEDPAALRWATAQLDEYLAGARRVFQLPLDIRGTPFQRRAWSVVAQIPYGHTMTYGEVAARLGQPGAARAVGAAMGQNPLPIVIPCHRVVGAQGRLVGYAGGLPLKVALLAQEGGRLV